jgi:hypothetical protein
MFFPSEKLPAGATREAKQSAQSIAGFAGVEKHQCEQACHYAPEG